MKLISLIGAFIVTLALFSYGTGSLMLQRFRLVSKGVLWFLSAGILLDITATVCMIIGSKNTPFTVHGFLGYTAFLVMFIDVIWVWSVYRKKGLNVEINKKLHTYSKLAYGFWVIAYITGSLLVIIK